MARRAAAGGNASDARSEADRHVFDLAFVDLKMRPIDGMVVLARLRERVPETPVVMITAHGSVESAVEAMKRGAFHYLQKPVNLEEMRTLIHKALDLYDVRHELHDLRETQRAAYPVGGILGDSPDVVRVREHR